jgi:Arc/MetJ-type ribon-helix-helix transcriptional regulator
MPTAKIAITLQAETVDRIDRLVRARVFPNRSRAIQAATEEMLRRLDRNRLARESARLDRSLEQAMADQGLTQELAEWPEY